MAKFMRNYLITWVDLDKGEKILIGDKDWQKKDGWTYPNLLTINLDMVSSAHGPDCSAPTCIPIPVGFPRTFPQLPALLASPS